MSGTENKNYRAVWVFNFGKQGPVEVGYRGTTEIACPPLPTFVFENY
jgi:hypothetical protein